VQAIIFLAPLTFNLALEEDPTVNRIEDSILIWKTICSNRLLERTTIILFLNKMDVLAAALESGLRVKDYVTSYGDLANDVPSVAKCMSFSLAPRRLTDSALQTSGINLRCTM
jgi:guanine nucleotide-binding protein alpha-1 subunit